MQMLALRQRWIPRANDSTESLAMAVWLEENDREKQTIAVANGIGKAFSG
jgi:hypothetical protein